MKICYEEFPFIDSKDRSRSKLYKQVEAYVGQRCWEMAEKLKVKPGKGKTEMKFSMDISRKSYQLTFNRRHRDVVLNAYLKHVSEEGKKILKQSKFQKIHSNEDDGWEGQTWKYFDFEHSASFRTLAMEPTLKQRIINDLETFRKGKSSLIAAMANHLQYDIYSLELTTIRDNIELNNLLLDTTKKAIIVIEDIDCTLDVTLTAANRTKKKKGSKEDDSNKSKLTLSGLLNSIDGLSSGCVQERIFVFTTNHIEKLDPALIRRGRMDMHIVMSYCRFEAFKLLAKNYLNIDHHPLFERIGVLLEEVDMTPGDIAEKFDAQTPWRQRSLVTALEDAKEAATLKAQEQKEQAAEKSVADGDHDDNEPC
ncbi:OLC1v1034935C1 [Oldenlandia corymbosa var. corymbosa]|uniref:OLC1v1034935C1 n=1 Tax=Oldenlandia corymbosa var. corymbosa TaxID=529605 RepID=A0AAV1CT44_OLDCO|nr:OLC1v1034935C1 [Oldenlandia corymbosa var. corymbosa]